MKELLKNHFMVVKNFISEEHAKYLSRVFYDKNYEKEFKLDAQVENSIGLYKPIESLEVLTYESPKLSQIIGQNVLPTYSYVRLYKSGNILEKHIDRASCEISVTVHLDGDTDWPIWIKTPEGKDASVTLQSGDGMVYFGCLAPHWRTEYTGENYSQMFLHYVRSRGSFGSLALDDNVEENKKRLQHSPLELKNILMEDYKFL